MLLTARAIRVQLTQLGRTKPPLCVVSQRGSFTCMSGGFDWIVIGSGFGGSVSALRLAEKGYRVLVLEKGRRFSRQDFPKNNTELRNWLWMPALSARGIFQMSFLRHVTILHGVGVGGGSLVYANTLPEPKSAFFKAPSWGHLADWEQELAPHYKTAKAYVGRYALSGHYAWRQRACANRDGDRPPSRPPSDRCRRVLWQAWCRGSRPLFRR